MNFTRTSVSLLLFAAIASTGYAETTKTRDQVKAELREAIRTGNVLAAGESGLKLNELNPTRYPQVAQQPTKTRAQVQAELADAIRDGTTIAGGEAGLTLREEFPGRYPAVAVAAGRSRQDVAAETREAIRTGDIIAGGESSLKLNEMFPRRYSNGRTVRAAQADTTTTTLSAVAQ